MGTVHTLFDYGHPAVACLVLFFGVIVPVIKAVLLVFELILRGRRRAASLPVEMDSPPFRYEIDIFLVNLCFFAYLTRSFYRPRSILQSG